jgi:DNA-binding MarR family transcriptional regulator
MNVLPIVSGTSLCCNYTIMRGAKTIDDLPNHLTLIGATCLGRAARRTANLVTRAYNQHLAPVGLEVTQFSILCTIAMERAKSASELADLVGVERSTLARNLDRLITAGLVAVQKGDGRRLIHRLTDKGVDTIAEALPLWRKAQDDLVGRLPSATDDAIREDFRLLRRAAKGVLAEVP